MTVNQSLKRDSFLRNLINTGFTFLGYSWSLCSYVEYFYGIYHRTFYLQEKKYKSLWRELCFNSLCSEVMDHFIVIQAFSSTANYILKKYVLDLGLKVIQS